MDAFTKTDTMAPGAARRFRLMERTHDEPGRERLEQFVAETFAQAHGATVHAFMPSMLGLEDGGGRLRCVLGLRGAESGELFLERYLDRPIEESIAQAAGLDSAIPRGTIVEVGNLAGRGCRAAMHLVARLPRDGTFIVAYCGCPHAASGRVVDALRERGFENTAVLDEGVLVWRDLGYPVEGESVGR